MNADALAAVTSAPVTRIALLVVMLAAPWAAARLVGNPARVRRAAAWAVTLVVVEIALSVLLPGDGLGMPRWLALLGAPSQGWFPADGVVVLGALLLPLVAVAAAAPGDPDHEPAPPALGLGAALAGAAGWLIAWPALAQGAEPVLFAELAAVAPLALGALAQGRAAAAATEAPSPSVSPSAPWQAAGAAPFLALEATGADDDAPSQARAAWLLAGGVGPPPTALDLLLPDAHAGWYVPDVVHPADTTLVAAAVALAAARGARALVISDAADVVGALAALPLTRVVGSADLRSELAAGRLPEIVVLSPDDLVRDGVAALVDSRSEPARALRATLGLVALPRLDRNLPLAATHALLALRRLELRLAAEGARTLVLATGHDTPTALEGLRGALPRHDVQRLPLGPRATPAVEIYLAPHRLRADGATPWPLRAAAMVGGAVIADPCGTLDPDDLPAEQRAALLREPTLGGRHAVDVLDARWLVALVRALPSRITTGAPMHAALWGLSDDPVCRFLADPAVLRSLAAAGRLDAPRLVTTPDNRAIARAHLRAALEEGRHDLASLSAAFGPSVVDELGPPPTERARAWRGADGRLVRAPLLAQRPAGPPVPPTVTEQVVQLVDGGSGHTLGHVDAINAATRLYPRRVLEVGGHRYEVGLHARDERRARLVLQPVNADVALTTPLLTTRLVFGDVVETWQQVQQERLHFRLATFTATVTETITGVRRGAAERVTYDPVTATFRTRVRVIGLDRPLRPTAARHLAASLGAVLRARLVVHNDDLGVVHLDASELPGWPAGVVVVDRNVQGCGIAEALDDAAVGTALSWVYAILHRCPCADGCPRCTPAVHLDDEAPDKVGVLAALGG